MEHGIGIGLTSGLPQRILIVQPRVNDRARSGVKPEEQSKSPMKPGAPPVGVCTAKAMCRVVATIPRALVSLAHGSPCERLVVESLPSNSLGAFPRSSNGARSRNLKVVAEIGIRIGPCAAEDFVRVSAISSSDGANQIRAHLHLALDEAEKRIKYRISLVLGVLGGGLNKHAAGRDNA